MNEMKKRVVNCDICDARKVNEEELGGFQEIIINADILLINKQSKAILNRLPIQLNIEETIQLEEDEEIGIIQQNGNFEITGNTPCMDKKILQVNGSVMIHPEAEEAMKSFIKIMVNGKLIYPESMAVFANQISVNGSVECYPDDYKYMKSKFVMNRYFPLQAREGGKYYATNQIQILDPQIDTALLLKKKVFFKTKMLYIREEKVEDCVTLFDETTKFEVIPKGFTFIDDDIIFSQGLLQKYGTCIYVRGDLYLNKDSVSWIQKLEKAYVCGTVYLPEECLREGKQKIECKEIELVKGTLLIGKSKFTVDRELLSACLDGISLIDCAYVEIEEDILPQEILNKLSTWNCAFLCCSEQQRGAVEMISKGSGKIGTKKEKKKLEECQMVNAERYIL